jgi:hypothetical protein
MLRDFCCPAPGCPSRVPVRQVACPRDWTRLPALLRRNVHAAGTPNARAYAILAVMAWFDQHPEHHEHPERPGRPGLLERMEGGGAA